MNMSCIAKLIEDGKLTREEAELFAKEYNANPQQFRDKITKNSENAQKNTKKSALDIKKIRDYEAQLTGHKSPFEFIEALITRGRGLGAKTDNVEFKIKQVHATVLQPLAKHLDQLRSKWGGLILDKKLLDNVTNVFFKGDGDDAAANSIANAMRQVFKDTNDLADKFGVATVKDIGNITPLSNRIQGMTYDEFLSITKDLVYNTEDIRKAYDSAMEGDEIFQEGLKFKSGDALAEYQKKIGGDSFSNLINYVDRLSADIASAHVLGKNAQATIRKLSKAGKLSNDETSQLINTYEHAAGKVKSVVPKGAKGAVSKLIQTLRTLGTAAMMGSSVLVAGLDIATMGLTARYNGLPVMKMYGKMLKNLASKDSRMELAQVGFQLESVLSSLTNMSRFNPHATQSNTLNNLATGVLRTSGLLAVSDAMKLAVKNTFLVQFKDLSKTTFETLMHTNPRMHKQLNQYGITKKDWDIMRKSMDDDIMLNPMKLTELNNEVGSKFFRLINEEADTAVVTPGARSAHWTSLGKDKGTLTGETVRSIAQFKSTIVEQITTHIMRATRQQGTGNQMAYGAQYVAATTILGGMVFQLKEISKGNTPADPTKDPVKFFAESLRQGGAIPYLTDTLIPNMIDPKYGTDGIESLFSPASLNKTTSIMKSATKAFLDGDEDKRAKAQARLSREVMSAIPGNNIVYLKAFTEYYKNFVSAMIDEKGERTRQRKKQKELEKMNQKSLISL